MDAGVENIAEAVRADDRAGVDPHPLADLGLAYRTTLGNSCGRRANGANHARRGCPPRNTAPGADLDFSPMTQCGPICAVGSICADAATTAEGWTPGGESLLRKEQRQHAGKGNAGVGHANDDFAAPR